MENSTLPPVSITQKVIAMHTTRKELCEKLLPESDDPELVQKLKKILDQSNRFTDQLMNELSNYGDAVSSQVNREEGYEDMAKSMIEAPGNEKVNKKDIDFEKFQEKLENVYKDILSDKMDLPESLKKILESQLSELENDRD